MAEKESISGKQSPRDRGTARVTKRKEAGRKSTGFLVVL